jgi:ribonuclease P protein component
MLPAAHRLRRSKDFAHTVRRGRRSSRGSVVVHLTLPATEPAETGVVLEPAKAGFVVSKAVGGAVVRNKVKRRLRHLVAGQLHRLPPGSVIVVRALADAGVSAYKGMALDLEKALDGALRPKERR